MRYTLKLVKTIGILLFAALFCSFSYANEQQISAVAWQKKALEYQAISRTVFSSATRRLSDVLQWWQTVQDPKANLAQKKQAEQLLTNWNAMPINEQKKSDLQKPLAVILDIDETILNNSPYAARRVRNKERFNEATWKAWINDRQATAIPGAVEFTQWADSHGIAVFYVSNRNFSDWQATADNLRAEGFPLLTRERLLLVDDSRGFLKNKISRRHWVDQHYRVIALFGDSLADFLSSAEADRHQGLATYDSWWGDRWYAMPNPVYGTWMDELTDECGTPPTTGKPAVQSKPQQSIPECIGEILTEDP
jgi:5'-nucleotidase (lipoprotein e(P4) family)